eukprot:850741-Prorocentrum_minimum.AAC.1
MSPPLRRMKPPSEEDPPSEDPPSEDPLEGGGAAAAASAEPQPAECPKVDELDPAEVRRRVRRITLGHFESV